MQTGGGGPGGGNMNPEDLFNMFFGGGGGMGGGGMGGSGGFRWQAYEDPVAQGKVGEDIHARFRYGTALVG